MSDDAPAPRTLTPCQREYLEHLKSWNAQHELSLKDYAQAQGLSVSGLYSAKRWLKVHGVWRGREISGAKRERARRPKLVPVRVRAPLAAPAMSSSFRVHLPGGVVLEVPEHGCPARCQALVAALMERGS